MRLRKKSKDTLKQMKMRTQQSKISWDTEKANLKRKFIALQDYLKTKINKQTKKPRRSSNKQYNFILKGSRKRATKKAKTSRKKEIIKIREEISEIEYFKNYKISMIPRA